MIYVQHTTTQLLLDGADGLPFFDSLDSLGGISAEDIDLILITHFHIDHCAALPYFTEKVLQLELINANMEIKFPLRFSCILIHSD